jgi:predicted permease
VLLVGAGLFVKSVQEVRRLDLGLDVDRLALVMLEIAPTATDTNELYFRAMDRLRTLPGVEAVAGTRSPFQWAFATDMQVEGRDSIPSLDGGGPYHHQVTEEYLTAVGLRLVEGRWITGDDREGAERVTVVSETMAKTLWPDGTALGRCLYVGGDNRGRSEDVRARGECTRIVGVVEDASRGSLEESPHMAYYLPIAQTPPATLRALYVRTAGEPAELAETLAAPLRSLGPEVRYATVQPLRALLAPQTRSWTLGAAMFSIFGVLALLVTAIGLYSVLAFDVAQSTREIVSRTALGAARRRLLAGVLLRGVRLALAGVAVGVGVAFLAAPYAADLLFHVSPRDPWVLGSAAVFLLAIAVAASLLPGIRATRVDAMEALRME